MENPPDNKDMENYLRKLGESVKNREKEFIPRCITIPSPDIELGDVDVDNVEKFLLKIDNQDAIVMTKYFVDAKPRFFTVLILTQDNDSITYNLSYVEKNSFDEIEVELPIILESKSADDATSEFDTIQKATVAMDLLYQKLFSEEKHDHAVFLKKYSAEKVNETVAWNEKSKPRIQQVEVDYVNFRLKNAVDPLNAWLAKELGVEKNSVNVKVPKIALCASGGGLRAAIGTRFFVDQLRKEGFLPAVSYMTTLSGSTWFMTDWLVNKQLLPTDGDPWKVNTRDVLGHSDGDALRIGSVLAGHNYFESSQYTFSSWFIELWADVIGHGYLTIPPKAWVPNDTRFSNIAAGLSTPEANSIYPWPIMTAVGENELDWFEFTPAQIGRLSAGSPQYSWVEPSAFGCKVTSDGKKIDSPPGDELGQLMATWGSAVTLELTDLDQFVGQTYGRFGKMWAYLTSQKYLVPPFECPSWEIPSKSNKIVLRDAGLGMNVPYPPAVELERGVEIIIALDVSADCWDRPADTLDLFSQWIKYKKHPKFPQEVPRFTSKTETEADKVPLRKAHIYDLHGVVVVYIPIAIEGGEKKVSTYKMKHDPDAQLLIYTTVMNQWNSIKKPLAELIKNKYSK